MNIAICDDDKEELIRIASIIERYKREHNGTVKYKVFNSSVELVSTMKNGNYKLYFLDIMMPVVNGLELAKEIRDFDSDASIVFLTSSPEFAVESYAVKAKDYILKPVKEDRVFAVIDEHIIDKENTKEGITIKTKKGIFRILFSKLVFIEVVNKHVYFHLSDNSVYEVLGRLSDYEMILLKRTEFMRVHRSYIVNLYQIMELNQKEITTHQGLTIPISRNLYKEVRDSYVKQMFLEEES